MPWASFLIFALGLFFFSPVFAAAFSQPTAYRGKIAGPILATSASRLWCSSASPYFFSKHLPPSAQAPKVGQKAPISRLQTPSRQNRLARLAALYVRHLAAR